LDERSIQAWSIQTGETVGKAQIKFVQHSSGSLTVDGSKVWVHNSRAEDQVWDFGTPDSSPVKLPNNPFPDSILMVLYSGTLAYLALRRRLLER
jgi:hypothetical protein